MFPKSTIIPDKFIAKEKFYGNGDFTTKLKRAMIDDVSRIVVINQFSEASLNVTKGELFPEIMVLKIILKNKDFNSEILNAMDKSIRASYVLFLLEHDDKLAFSIAFKDKNATTITTNKRWTTPWNTNIPLTLEGKSIDLIYASLVNQIASLSGAELSTNPEIKLKEKVKISIKNEKLERKIAQLEKKISNEPQFKKQIALKAEIKKLKEGLSS